MIDVTKPPYCADRTGAIDSAPAINRAIRSAGKGETIYLPAGTYLCIGGLIINNDIKEIRGDGEDTIILP